MTDLEKRYFHLWQIDASETLLFCFAQINSKSCFVKLKLKVEMASQALKRYSNQKTTVFLGTFDGGSQVVFFDQKEPKGSF